MFLLYRIIQLVSLLSLAKGDKNIEIEFIDNYVSFQNETTTVTAFLCWDFDDITNIYNKFFERNVLVNIRNPKQQNLNVDKIWKNLNVVDITCNGSKELLHKVNTRNLFATPNHWLIIFPNEEHKNTITEIFNQFNIFIDSRVILATKQNNDEFSLDYIYKYGELSNIKSDYLGLWTNTIGFRYYDTRVVLRKRKNLNGYLLSTAMVVLNNSTYEHMTDYRYNHVDTTTKLNYVLTFFLMDYLNATVKVLYVPNWYSETTNNHTNTLVGHLMEKKIHITGSPYFCLPDRVSWLECVAMTTPATSFFIFRPPPLSYIRNIYAMPFGTNLWLTDISMLLLSALLLYAVSNWEWKIIKEEDRKPEPDMISDSFSDAVLFTIGAVCQQGYATETKGTPGKLLMLTIFVTLIFLFTAYTAYTVVLFQATADNINTLEDLYKSKMALGSDDKPYFKKYFPYLTQHWHRLIYRDRLVGNFMPLEQGIARVRTDYFAFYVDVLGGWQAVTSTFLEHEKCGLQQINYMDNANPYIVAPRRIPYADAFRVGYRRIQEVGLNLREVRRRIARRPECTSQGNNYRSASAKDLYPLYVLLAAGIGLSLAALAVEVLVHHWTTSRKSRIHAMRDSARKESMNILNRLG